MKDALVICIYARKGGSGRTLIAQQLAGACAERGASVLLIDQDPQGSLSKNFFGATAVERLRPHQTVAAIYGKDTTDYSALIRQSDIPQIAIVPSSDHMQPYDYFSFPRFSDDIDEQKQEENRLQFALREFVGSVVSDYDIVFIDTPPNAGNFPALAALNASSYVLTPVKPSKNSAEALLDVKTRLLRVMDTTNPALVDLGCFITDYDQRTSVHRVAQQRLRQLHGSQVFETVIYRRTAFEEAPYSLKPLTHVQPASEEAEMIRKLLAETAARITESRESLTETKVANE